VCDVTNIPFKENVVDDAISLHTIYHVPRSEQKTAFKEIYRTLKPRATCVIVYSWGKYSLLMNICLFPIKFFTLLKIIIQTVYRGNSSIHEKELYFQPHTYRWFKKNIQTQFECKLVNWRSVSVPFIKTYIHGHLFGKRILKLIYLMEKKYPELFGRVGQYPMFVFKKK